MNTLDLRDRDAIITGGASGIGRETAVRMVASGARVALWDRNADAAKTAAAEIGGDNALGIAVNVGDADSIAHGLDATVRAFGKVDILVNSAGVAGDNYTLWETPIEEWQRVININLNGVFLCCRAVVPTMIAAGYGRIVNIASIAGKEGNPKAAHYSASKAGVIGLTKSLGKELATKGVICNCVTPALIRTPIMAQNSEEHNRFMAEKIPMQRLGNAQEVAALITWLASEDCSFSTGAVFDISGGRATY